MSLNDLEHFKSFLMRFALPRDQLGPRLVNLSSKIELNLDLRSLESVPLPVPVKLSGHLIPGFICRANIERFFDGYIVTFLKRIMVFENNRSSPGK